MKRTNNKPIGFEELRQIQLHILDTIDAFCKEHDIQYSLAFGTLLGAVRHGGYIPWDDDLDIMMTRDNYNKFRDLYKSEHYPFLDLKIDNNHPVPLGKVYDSRTFFYYKGYIKRKYGVFVDIFPIDNVPTDNSERIRWVRQINRYIFFNSVKCNSWSLVFKSKRSLLYKFLCCCLKFFVSSHFIHSRLEKMYVKYDNEDTEYMGAPMIFNKMDVWRIYPRTCFMNYFTIKFEGKEYMSIQEYDKFLKIRYDNYMQLPPESERVSKHGIVAYYK